VRDQEDLLAQLELRDPLEQRVAVAFVEPVGRLVASYSVKYSLTP